MHVYAATVEHKHGTDLYVCHSLACLHAEIADYCRNWWEDELPDEPTPGPDESDIEIIDAYFDHVEGEYVNMFGVTEVSGEPE